MQLDFDQKAAEIVIKNDTPHTFELSTKFILMHAEGFFESIENISKTQVNDLQ